MQDSPTSSPVSVPSSVAICAPERRGWSELQRLLFRFVFWYFLLYSFPFPIDRLPFQYLPDRVAEFFGTYLFAPWSKAEDQAVLWTGKHFFDLDITIRQGGSGDTTWNYVQMLCLFAASAALALLWTAIDRFSTHYRRLHDWWRVYNRFVLGATMIGYGCHKVIPLQMPPPTLDRLSQPLGEMSPMGLLWSFLGASKGYEIFSGAAELLGGWLLVTRHTTTLGALVSAAVMGNVVALNFFYDTPVKLYSSHLFCIAILLLLPDLRRLARVLVLNRPVLPAELGRLFPWRVANWAAFVLGVAFFGHLTWQSLSTGWETYKGLAEAPRSPLHGHWVVETFKLDGAPVVGDENEVWRRLVVGSPSRMGIATVGDPYERYVTELDSENRRIELTKRGDPDWKATLGYELPSAGRLLLYGRFEGHDIYAELKLIPEPEYLLVTRGFHWINEVPLNR